MKFSSSFKVGLLTLLSLILLIGVVIKVKGRAISSAPRVEIQFKDVNGMRPGAGVQMMGLKVGQVEQITPTIDGEDSYVKVKFVITNPQVKIPRASTFSIQQSGLIGELFLEITPPKTRTIYIPMINKDVLFKDDAVEMKLSDKYYDVGIIRDVQIVHRDALPYNVRDKVQTNYAYRVDYIINLPGLIMPNFIKGEAVTVNGDKKLRIAALDNTVPPYPEQKSPYTIIEPMRIADFLNWQYKAAESLTETNMKVNTLLSDQTIGELQATVNNIDEITKKASVTVDKINQLIDDSKSDIKELIELANHTAADFNALAGNLNNIVGDPVFKKNLISTTTSIDQLARNLNKIMGNEEESKKMAEDIRTITNNLAEISTSVTAMTKDEQLKNDLKNTLANTNKALENVSMALASVNKMTPDNKTELDAILDDAKVTTANLRKFSEKLNKRFLIFRLLF
ncbi:MAG: MlaD family protein [Candidatus Gastranaerophilaceae bacterium]|nr:MlaD family protein [Candidatus Gastranaerophilaceae bacterium]